MGRKTLEERERIRFQLGDGSSLDFLFQVSRREFRFAHLTTGNYYLIGPQISRIAS